MSLPRDFLLGAATAAHQVEGNNIYSDDWALEQMKNTSFTEPSGIACDHYHRYAEDIRLMAEAGLNAYRFSIEWARIEPREDAYDEREIAHYRDVIRCCKENGITPIVTMHHFTSPLWLIRKGGWEAESTIADFRDYCVYVMERLGNEIEYVCTINEANMGLQLAAVSERYRRQMMAASTKKDQASGVQVGLNLKAMMERMQEAGKEHTEIFGTPQPQTFVSNRTPQGDQLVMRSHEAARDAMKAICPHLKIGLTLSLHDIQFLPGGEEKAMRAWDEEFTHYLPYIRKDDFFGLQNYTRAVYGADGPLPADPNTELTQMGYEFYPQALENVIQRVSAALPINILVTENGIATADDARRQAFIAEAINGVQRCIQDGIPVKGYLYWSLLDNFEWQKGYSMTFGLVAVDRKTQERAVKESLKLLGSKRN